MTTSDHPHPPHNTPHTGNERVSAGHSVADGRLGRLAELIAGSPHNLVSAAERGAVLARHVGEGDLLAAVLRPRGRWMDLGTGGGLPGLVLAVRHPATHWVLVDATAKKVSAVAAFAEELDLQNVTAVHSRAESLAHEAGHRGAFDGVVARAVAPLATLVELARGFLRPGGELVAVKGPRWQAEAEAAMGAMRTLRMRLLHSAELPGAERPTWIVTIRADGPPPPGFPRRDGIPKQDPLR